MTIQRTVKHFFVYSFNRTTVPAVIGGTKASKSVPTLIVLCRDMSCAVLLYNTQCVAGCTHLCKATTGNNNITEKCTLFLFCLCLSVQFVIIMTTTAPSLIT